MQIRLTSLFRPLLLGAVLVGAGSVATLFLYKPVMAQDVSLAGLSLAGFKIRDVTFDNSVAEAKNFGRLYSPDGHAKAAPPMKPMPKIPKSWRLVGVSQGYPANVTNLWFQDTEGGLFLVRGALLDQNEFTMLETINRIGTKFSVVGE